MRRETHSHGPIFVMSWNSLRTALRTLVALLFQAFILLPMIATGKPAYAQTYQVIHSFRAQTEGSGPECTLTIDAFGSLYGTAARNGPMGTERYSQPTQAIAGRYLAVGFAAESLSCSPRRCARQPTWNRFRWSAGPAL